MNLTQTVMNASMGCVNPIVDGRLTGTSCGEGHADFGFEEGTAWTGYEDGPEAPPPPLFDVIIGPFGWAVLIVVSMTLSLMIFNNCDLNIPPTKLTRLLGIISLAYSMFASIPFLNYLRTGKSAAASVPNNGDSVRIHIHAFVMVVWLVIQTFLITTAICGRYRLHKRIGRYALNVQLPLTALENMLNAGILFLPKLAGLAQAHRWPQVTTHPSAWQALIYALPYSAALLTPELILVYGYLATNIYEKVEGRELRQLQKNLHAYYMTNAILTIMSTGSIRHIFEVVYESSGCPRSLHEAISAYVQHNSGQLQAILYPIFMSLIAATLPLKVRVGPARVPGVVFGYYVFVMNAYAMVVTSALFGFPLVFRCNPHGVEALLAGA